MPGFDSPGPAFTKELMILYHTLRRFALALRTVRRVAVSVASKAHLTAENVSVAAKAAAAIHMEKIEDRAHRKVRAAIEHTDYVMERLLDAEDAAQDDYEAICYANTVMRDRILNEEL